MGSCFLCSFCKKRVFLKRRKYDGSYWTVLRPVFSLSTRYSASIRLGKAVRISPINLRASMCLRKRKARDCAGRLSESPNFSYSLMLKNSCGKLTHRAATIGAVGVSPAGKAGLMMCSSRERPFYSLPPHPYQSIAAAEVKERFSCTTGPLTKCMSTHVVGNFP